MDKVAAENIIAVVGLLMIIVGGYFKLQSQMQTKLKELEIRLHNVEKQDDRIMDKLDSIADNISDIKIDLQNKQNRP